MEIVARLMPSTSVGDRTKDKLKTDKTTRAGEGGPRGMGIPHYSRTLYRAPKTGLRSSNNDVENPSVQLCVQDCRTRHDRAFGMRKDCNGGVRAGRGSGRPLPWPPPAAVCLK